MMKEYLFLIDQYLNNTISQNDRETLLLWVTEKKEHENIFKKEIGNWSLSAKEIPVNTTKAFENLIALLKKK
ncbi:hypothetical protein [Aquimarina litoralis]|uniref:hypothetical protein n=1 Tax=Aquimarina litoralis TaxID=584605 RepID=UPI001C590861|nr:hypothetical protein [Aquimarina litoralis]MBW1294565.1 hypothetical protein [Aquimarina litoralis]